MKDNKVYLADIGNTYFHIYDGETVIHLSYEDAIKEYKDKTLKYISVKHQFSNEFASITSWENISSLMKINGEYKTMGIDRKALCWSQKNAILVDAGTAITVDIMSDKMYVGGFILPGLSAYIETYKRISPALDITFDKSITLVRLPCTTKEQISYGIIASIKALIEKHCEDKTLYFTGGDGKLLSSFFENAIYDEMLVFNGMQKALNYSTK